MTPPAPLNSLSDKILSDKGEMDPFSGSSTSFYALVEDVSIRQIKENVNSHYQVGQKTHLTRKSPHGEHLRSSAWKLCVARWESRKLRLMAQSLIYGPDTFGAAQRPLNYNKRHCFTRGRTW